MSTSGRVLCCAGHYRSLLANLGTSCNESPHGLVLALSGGPVQCSTAIVSVCINHGTFSCQKVDQRHVASLSCMHQRSHARCVARVDIDGCMPVAATGCACTWRSLLLVAAN